MDELQKLNKINFNFKKYNSQKEVEDFIKDKFKLLLEYHKKNDVFSKKFLDKSVLIDFSICIDEIDLFEGNYFNHYEVDSLVPNFNLLDYLFLDCVETDDFNFYSCSCGYPECGGFYGVPYIIFNTNGKILVQLLLDRERGYGSLIAKLKEKGVFHDQKFIYENIIHSYDDGYSKIQEHFNNPNEERMILTFNYGDFISFQNKVMEVVKKSRNIITVEALLREEGYLFEREEGDDFHSNIDIKKDLMILAKSQRKLIKKYSFKSKIAKRIKKVINSYFRKNSLSKNILFMPLKQKEIGFYKDSKVFIETYQTTVISIIFAMVFNRQDPFKSIGSNRRVILNNWKEIEKEIYLFLDGLYLLKEKGCVNSSLTKEIVLDKNLFQKWLRENQITKMTLEDVCVLIQNVFSYLEENTKDDGFRNFINITTQEELIYLFNSVLENKNGFFCSLNKNTSPDWMEEGEKEFKFLIKG